MKVETRAAPGYLCGASVGCGWGTGWVDSLVFLSAKLPGFMTLLP